MSKISNVITMLELLNNGRKYSVSELANTIEVTPRMIRIYKEELEKAGIYIDTIRGPYGGYILNQKVYIPIRNVEHDKVSMNDQERIIYNIVAKALKEKKKVKLLYLSSNDLKERIIHPIDLYIYNHSWYIPAFCELRNEMRHFELKNIKKIELLEEFYK